MSVGGIQALLGGVLVREKKHQEAEKYLTGAYAILIRQPKTYAGRVQETRANLALAYDALGQPASAPRFRGEFTAADPQKIAAPVGKQ